MMNSMKKYSHEQQSTPMIKTILANRELITIFASKEFILRYKNSVLGYLWAVLPQLATVLLFSLLVSRRVFNMGYTDLPYVLHALWSLSLWQFFSATLLGCQQSLSSSGTLLTKVKFESSTLVVASLFSPFVDYCIRLIIISIFCLWYELGFSITMLLIPIPIALIALMAFGIGLYLSCLNLLFKDLANVVSMILTFGIFLSPIFYPPPTEGWFVLVNLVNPFSPLLIATQELLAGELPSHWLSLSYSLGFCMFFVLTGWRFYQRVLPKVIEYS